MDRKGAFFGFVSFFFFYFFVCNFSSTFLEFVGSMSLYAPSNGILFFFLSPMLMQEAGSILVFRLQNIFNFSFIAILHATRTEQLILHSFIDDGNRHNRKSNNTKNQIKQVVPYVFCWHNCYCYVTITIIVDSSAIVIIDVVAVVVEAFDLL